VSADRVPSPQGHAARGPHAGGRQAGGSSSSSSVLLRLEELLREQGGLMASLLPAQSTLATGHGPAQVVAAGPRVGAGAAEYELLVEAIYEGYLLHYGSSRLLCPTEADLGLLAGDQLYALGLARLVAMGDLVAVAELADVITLTALAHGAGDGELAAAIWDAGARAVGWGPSAEHEQAKALARAGAAEALQAMRAVAAGASDGKRGGQFRSRSTPNRYP
jgi:hypothetical protein